MKLAFFFGKIHFLTSSDASGDGTRSTFGYHFLSSLVNWGLDTFDLRQSLLGS